jgi:ABC-type phosphate/phosphonate transport system permease subunit
MMQVKIGSGGSRPMGMRFGGGMIRSALQSASSPENWIYVAGIVVLLIIVVVLVALIAREFYLRKKKKA